MRRSALILAVLALVGTSVPLRAQAALLDSLRPQIERAVVRGEWTAIDPIIGRLRAATRGTGARDPWTHYDLGYALHRRASALLIAERIDQAKPMLEEAEKALAKAQELGGGATATALRGAVTGQLAGTGGMMAGMRQGPRAFRLLDEALKQSPNDPLVALLNGLTRLNAPAAFGGGPNRAEPELRRAVTLFATHRPAGPGPVWGRVDALIWHAIALEKQGKRNEARIELTQALGLAPGHAWITRELLPKLDAAR